MGNPTFTFNGDEIRGKPSHFSLMVDDISGSTLVTLYATQIHACFVHGRDSCLGKNKIKIVLKKSMFMIFR